MNLAECLICWSPNTKQVPVAERGRFALCPDTAFSREAARNFRYLSGAPDPCAADARLQVRMEFVTELAHTLVSRDRLPARLVHDAMLAIDEYASAWRDQLDARCWRLR